MRQNTKGLKKLERGQEKQNKETWYESGDLEKTNAGRRKRMRVTRERQKKGVPSGEQNEEEKQVGLESRAADLRLDGGMYGGIVGREKVFEEERKPSEELFGELQRDPCLATEGEQVGEVCSTSKERQIWEVCVCVAVCMYHMSVSLPSEGQALKRCFTQNLFF